jgi:MFS family permease
LGDASGLKPLDDSAGLTPLDPLTPSGLTPLDEPSGLTPLVQNPLGDLSSLEYSAAGAQVNPYRAPAAVAMPQVRRRRSGDFGYVEVLSCTWYTFWDNWTTCLLAPLLLVVLHVGVGIAIGVLMFLFRLGAQALQRIPDFPMVILYGAALIMMVLLFLVGIFMVFFVQAGMAYISSAMVRGKNVSASDVFAGAPFILPLLGATIVQTLISFALGMVLGLPIGVLVWLTRSPLLVGIAYFLSFCLNMLVAILLLNTQFLIVDQEQGVFSAISESVNSMKDKIPVTVALFLTVLVGLVAFLVVTLGLGILLAFPFLWVFIATIYAKATGQKTPF